MIGWLEAGANVVAIGVLGLAYAIGFRLGAHPVAFILYAMIASAAGMLAWAGPGSDAAKIARHPLSWVVGSAIILIELFYYLTISYVSPAHGNLVLRIGVPIAMVAGWLWFHRRPPALAWAGAAVIVVATVFVIGYAAPEARTQMALAGLASAVFMVVRGYSSEFHPWNRAARTVREKMRITGIVVLITSLLGLTLTGTLAALIAAGVLPPTPYVPGVAQMLHGPTIALGALLGGAILMSMAYFGFSAVVKIGTSNLVAAMSFSPLTTWVFQALGNALGLIDVPAPEPRVIVAMSVVIGAVLLIFWAEGRARRRAAGV